MTFKTFDQSDEETWPDQQKDNDKYKDKDKNKQIQLIESVKKSDLYKSMLDNFPDAELIEVGPVQKDDK